MRAIRDRLREMYGQPVNEPHGHPIAELIKTVLSQHTNDRNRDRSFAQLRERYPTWEEVRDAPLDELEEAIRPGGLAKQKAPRIQAILERLGEHPDLDWTETAPREESLEFLLSLPGVGRKTAACVLIFTWDIPEIPVDVHVHRVGGRLGLFPARASFERAHDEMLAIVDPADAYELHMNLIRHGRDPLPPETPLRGVRAASHVPLVPRPGAWVVSAPRWDPRGPAHHPNEQEDLHHLRAAGRLPRGPDPLACLPRRRRLGPGAEVPAGLEPAKALFETNCGTCHTLYAAETDGNFGPDLDELLAPSGPPEGATAEQTIEATGGRVLNAIEAGVDSQHRPGPHAGRHPLRRAGRRSRRVRRPHRRRGLALAGGRISRAPDASTSSDGTSGR